MRTVLPRPVRRFFWRRARRLASPRLGDVDLGDLLRVKPLRPYYGLDFGFCVDRYYIEGFLGRHAEEIRGRVLEIGEPRYALRFGGDRVSAIEVLHVEGCPEATIVADLATAGEDVLPSESFDCIILTQTLTYIYEVKAAVRTLHRILRPGGVVLGTVPSICQISRPDMDRWGEYWRFTTRSVSRLFGDAFGPANVSVTGHGNVLAAVALLHGIVTEDLDASDLDHVDEDYEIIVCVRARRST